MTSEILSGTQGGKKNKIQDVQHDVCMAGFLAKSSYGASVKVQSGGPFTCSYKFTMLSWLELSDRLSNSTVTHPVCYLSVPSVVQAALLSISSRASQMPQRAHQPPSLPISRLHGGIFFILLHGAAVPRNSLLQLHFYFYIFIEILLVAHTERILFLHVLCLDLLERI